MRLICHRGFWWPYSCHQNRPWALTDALDTGWDVEVDVWGVHGSALKIGHQGPESEWTLPPPTGNSRLYVHLKVPIAGPGVMEALTDAGWADHAAWFISPELSDEPPVCSHVPRLQVIASREMLCTVLSSPAGCGGQALWVEQPDLDWVTADDIATAQAQHCRVLICSSELHGRMSDLARVTGDWNNADGIVTDLPHLFDAVLHPTISPAVHPAEPWW